MIRTFSFAAPLSVPFGDSNVRVCAGNARDLGDRSREALLFYDQLLVKEPGTSERSPWHRTSPTGRSRSHARRPNELRGLPGDLARVRDALVILSAAASFPS